MITEVALNLVTETVMYLMSVDQMRASISKVHKKVLPKMYK